MKSIVLMVNSVISYIYIYVFRRAKKTCIKFPIESQFFFPFFGDEHRFDKAIRDKMVTCWLDTLIYSIMWLLIKYIFQLLPTTLLMFFLS